jgi:hypothetical protein
MGLFSQRKSRLKELGLQLTADPSQIATEMEMINVSLANVADLRELVETNGWKILEEQLGGFVKQQIKGIYQLAADPVKNQAGVVVRYAMAESVKRLLALVHNALEEGKLLEHRKSQLRNQ